MRHYSVNCQLVLLQGSRPSSQELLPLFHLALEFLQPRAVLVGVEHDIMVLGKCMDWHWLQASWESLCLGSGREKSVHETLRAVGTVEC